MMASALDILPTRNVVYRCCSKSIAVPTTPFCTFIMAVSFFVVLLMMIGSE